MTEHKVLAILMAAHPRLGLACTLPYDVVNLVAGRFKKEADMEERIEALEHRVKRLEEERNLLIMYPHTIHSCNMLLGFHLTREQQGKADLLAYKIFTHVHPGLEATENRYADAWIVRLAVQKTAAPDCAGPSEIPSEIWRQLCAEVRKRRFRNYTD